MEVLAYRDYRKIITDSMQGAPRQATRSQLARAINCSPSWVTRVLTGDVQLTPDQALGVCQHFRFNETETDYFLLLVELERAATAELKSRLRSKLKSLTQTRRNFAAALKTDSTITDEDRLRYYSSWIYAATHVACMIQSFSIEGLAERIKLQTTAIVKVLADLEKMGLVINQAGRWSATSKNIHLSAEHFMGRIGHAIWRNRTIQFLQDGSDDGLHYSAVHCLSKADVEVIRQKLKEAVLDCRKLIDPSAAETMAVLCLDWYEI